MNIKVKVQVSALKCKQEYQSDTPVFFPMPIFTTEHTALFERAHLDLPGKASGAREGCDEYGADPLTLFGLCALRSDNPWVASDKL